MNPFMALGMKQNTIVGTGSATHHAGNAAVKTPSRDPGNSCIADRAALFLPEKTKKARTPKRFLHVSAFAFLEVRFTDGVVGVGVASDLDMSLDGDTTSQE